MLANKLRQGGILDTQSVTVGTYSDKSVTVRGFNTGVCGSVSDGTFNPKAGASITAICWVDTSGSVVFEITGALSNAGWTNMSIGANNYARASATFSGAGPTSWSWVASDPFGLDASVSTVVFT